MSKLVVIVAGGNSLIKDEQHKSIPAQYIAAVETSKHIAGIIKQGSPLPKKIVELDAIRTIYF